MIDYRVDGDGIAIVTWNVPGSSVNTLTDASTAAYVAAMDKALADPAVKGIVVTSAKNDFIAGADVQDFLADRTVAGLEAGSRAINHVFRRLEIAGKPMVAAINGTALGGGLELALACDMLVAAEGAKLGQPEIKLGVFPPIAAILLPRIVPVPRAMELVLGGGTIDAREALSIGLVNRVFPRESFAADTAKFLEPFLSLSRVALLYTKRAMRVATGRPFLEALHDVEQIYLKELMATEDATEGLNSFMEKRKPIWKNR